MAGTLRGKNAQASLLLQHHVFLNDYGYPVIMLDEKNMICFANHAFYKEMHYSSEEIENKKRISDLSLASSEKDWGAIEGSSFRLPGSIDMSSFIALRDKNGVLRYFFMKTKPFDKTKKLLFLYDHSGPFSEMSQMMKSSLSYQQIFDSFPGLVFVFDRNLNVLDVNTDMKVAMLDSAENMRGKHLSKLNIPDFLKKLTVENANKCWKEKREVKYEYSLHFDDQIQNFTCRMVYRPDFIMALIHDTTREKAELTLLAERRQEMSDMFNDMPVAVVEVNEDGAIQYGNTTFSELVIFSGELPSENIIDYLGTEMFDILKANGKNHHTHCMNWGKLYVDIASKKRIRPEGVHFLLTIIDVTEREKSKLALQKSEINYKALVDTSPNGIIIRDNKQVYYANPEALKILGFKKPVEVDLSKVMDANSLKLISKRLVKVARGEKVGFSEFMITPMGSEDAIMIETKPVLIEYHGKPAFQIVFRNISVEKLLLEEKVKKHLLEEHNRKLMDEIAYRIEIENELKKIVDENKLLLNEVHHRVKNNYQVVSSMLNRYLTNITDAASIKAISATKSRLASMAVVNEFCLDEENYNSISLIAYLEKIYQHFVRENGSVSVIDRVKFTTSIRKLMVDINDAVPIGLIFNEILTLLQQVVVQLNDNNCNFVALKWQNKKNLMFTVRFDKNMSALLEKEMNSSMEFSAINDFLEQVNGKLVFHSKNAELQLIVKLSKIN